MIYGYCRVSTKGQVDGTSLSEQKDQILKMYDSAEIYMEQYTGGSMDRPVLNAIVEKLQNGDILVTTKLDRFCRTTKEGLALIDTLLGLGVRIHILNMGLIEDTPMGRLIVTNLLAFAEFERALIRERCVSGKEIARTRDGFTEGRPKKYTEQQLQDALRFLELGNTYSDVERHYKISKSTLLRFKRRKNAEI